MDELKGVLQRPKFGFPPEAIQAILSDLTAIGHIVRPSISINQILEDPQDNRILECAVEGDADYIISGDTHLLNLKQHEAIRILSPNQFVENLTQDC